MFLGTACAVQESEAVKIVGSQQCDQGDPGLCAGDALLFWSLISHVMANRGILIKFDTSHHALVLEATLVLLIAQMILSKLWQHGVKTILPRWGGHLAHYGPDLSNGGGCAWLATLQQQPAYNAHLNRQKSRDWCTVKFFDLQSSGVFGRNHCSSEASMSLDLAALWFHSPALESVVMLCRRLTEGLNLPLYFDRLCWQTNVILEHGFGIYNSGYGVLLQKFTGMHSYGQRMF